MIDLMKFCSTPSTWNKNSNAPYSIGEFTYATNGHIAVRVPRLPDIGEVEGAPKADSLDWASVNTDKWIEIPEFPKPKPQEETQCETCNGDVTSYHDCPSCTCKCEDCENGVIITRKTTAVKIGSKSASDIYLTLLKTLPGILISPDATKKECVIPFKFDDGCGLLMPMRDES